MDSSVKARLGGLFLLAMGGLAGWWGIWRPLQAARAHAPEVEYSFKLFLLAPMCLVFGLFLVAVGDTVQYRDAEKQKLTAVGWALFAIAALITLGAYFGLEHLFAQLGYGSSRYRP